MKKRIPYIDTCKFVCIFLMVIGHWSSNSLLLLYIYSFHMPALFVISGFLYKPRSWHKTILSFSVPFFFYSLLNLFFLLIIGDISIDQLFSKALFLRFLHYRYGLGDGFFCGDWFLWALLSLRLLFGDIDFLAVIRKYYVPISFIVIIYMTFETYLLGIDTLFHGWYIGRLIPSLPFFCFGFLLKESSWSPCNIAPYELFLLSIASVIFPFINGFCSINSNEFGMAYMIYFFSAIATTLLLLIISNYVPTIKFIQISSKGTLLILGMHMPIMRGLSYILPNIMFDFLPFLVIPICFFPILWLDRHCPILLGKLR